MARATIDARLTSNPATFLKFLKGLMDRGEGAKATALAEQALATADAGSPLASAAAVAMSQGLPRYHWPMLADEARNRAYAAAIERAAPAANLVLDIGAGSGLLAMLAARSGAARIVACEANSTMAATAIEVVAANDLDDRINVVGKHSTELDREEDLGGYADLIVTETFGHDLVGEGSLPAVADALRRLATPEAVVIPARAKAMVALSRFARQYSPVGEVCGLDLSLLNRHAPAQFTLPSNDPSIQQLSGATPLFTFEMAAQSQPTEARIELVSAGGPIDGIVQWLRLELDEQSDFEQPPGASARSHWKAVCWPFDQPLETRPGDVIAVHGWTDLINMRIRVEAP